MKLTEQQIAFINNYLKNSGVEYVDIRYEMTDHVATALEDMEGDFYNNFTQYMLEHKKQLLESNKEFGRTARNKAVKYLFTNMVSRPGIIVFGAIFSLFCFLSAYMEYEAKYIMEILPNVIIIIMGVNVFYSNLLNRKKLWSGTDKALGTANFILYFLIMFIKPHRFISNEPILMLYHSVIITFTGMAFITYWQLKKKYKLQYDG